ncbi:DUF5367 family protein [Spongiivirga citrea]|uniref:DUF5367 domain-containing protein n=1 Tax=Spongiivirga citrea TaxID=1481457 RepID=A0A6M0CIW5_9FLAO|nr:DUF5367 family protein [Spongiivirga citrea]NER17791.1 hypothetical protein [Spongiivirga citrea]
MKEINIKGVVISGSIAWVLAVMAFVASYFVPILSDPDLQANWVLSVAIIPSACIGAYLYYQKGHKTNGFILGVAMFLVAMMLDALITVPFLIIPSGSDYISFFTDLGFWLIALEYVSVVVLYWHFKRTVDWKKMTKPPNL